MLDVRDLKCLVVLAEELHFNRTAVRLRMAQPALTKRIQKIEAELGVDLFTRRAGGVALTGAGFELLDHARRMLGEWHAMQRDAEQKRTTADKTNATVQRVDEVPAGVHINAIGGDCPGKTELDVEIVRRIRVFVEHTPQTRIEGEIQKLPADFPVTELCG
ncbi:hypothetical protein ABIB37_001236 [Agrococcus sp. UYP10]|uniref:LysR family transcriptional regulator n=1 Tax=Agrococcus sp. UYP10 TaxID=1756355 RepID=UPI003397AC76